jgi:hypothetical protein
MLSNPYKDIRTSVCINGSLSEERKQQKLLKYAATWQMFTKDLLITLYKGDPENRETLSDVLRSAWKFPEKINIEPMKVTIESMQTALTQNDN